MRARGWWVTALVAFSTSAAAEPKPKPVDIKPLRDKLVVLTDSAGGTYVVQPEKDSRVFYQASSKKPFYEQIVIGRSSDGPKWSVQVWAPRVSKIQPGSVYKTGDDTYARYC